MPVVWSIGRRRRIQPLSLLSRVGKPHRKKHLFAIKLMKLFAAILVPLMIGAFTIVTTLQDSNSARYQREADLLRIEHQGKLQEESEKRQRLAEWEKLHEQFDYNDRVAKEARIQHVYDAYLSDLNNIVLKPNANITIPELLFVRSKTLSVLDQIDVKRKWYLIKFLYDSELLYVRKSGYRYIDLGGSDLSNVRFGSSNRFNREINLEKIQLMNAVLINTTFYHVVLKHAAFDNSDLSGSRFEAMAFFGMSFFRALLDNSEFYLRQLQNCSFVQSSLKGTLWSFELMQIPQAFLNVDFSETNLTDSKFRKVSFPQHMRWDHADLDRSEFFNLKFSPGHQFRNVTLRNSRFIQVMFDGVAFLQVNLSESYFENCSFRAVHFDYVDMQKTLFYAIPTSSKIDFNRANLIGSNLNISYLSHLTLSNSFLPNGTFVTSFRSLGTNSLQNGGAEDGQCYAPVDANITGGIIPPGWERSGDVFQVLYNTSHWKIDDIVPEWQSCLFFATAAGGSKKVVLRQIVNVTELAVLIDTNRARLQVSGYLGGFEDDRTVATLSLVFRKRGNRNETASVGKVSNLDRRNRTALVLRQQISVVPVDTIAIVYEVTFERIQSANVVKLGLADQLSLIIRPR